MIFCELCGDPPDSKEVKATHRYHDVDGMTYSVCDECAKWVREVSNCEVWKISRSSKGSMIE